MGRPLSRRFFGRSNTDTSGLYSQNALTSDAELGGQPLVGITVSSAGTFAGSALPSTIAGGASNTLTFGSTTTALPVGTPITIGGTISAGTLTFNSVAPVAGSTYYVSSATAATTTSCVLAPSYANAVAGTNTVVINNTGSIGSLTFYYNATASLTFPAPLLATEGAVTAVGTPAYNVASAVPTLPTAGSGSAYQIGQVLALGTASYTAVNLAASASLTVAGAYLGTNTLTISTATFYRGQSILVTGTFAGTGSIQVGSTTYNSTNSATNFVVYIATASSTSTTTLSLSSTYALALAGTSDVVITAGTPTGLTFTQGAGTTVTATASNIVLTSTSGAFTVPAGNYYTGQQIVITGSNSGTSNVAASTIYVQAGGINVTSITTASSFANAIAGSGGNTYTLGASGTVTGLVFQFGNGAGAASTLNTTTGLYVSVPGGFTPATITAGPQVSTTTTGVGTANYINPTYQLFNASFTGLNNLSNVVPTLGDGYLAATVGTASITSTTASASTTITGGSIAGGILTITSASSGGVVPGMVLSGGSISNASTYVVSRLTGTATGASTYQLGANGSNGQAVTATVLGAITGTPTTGTLNAITVASPIDMIPGMSFTPASSYDTLTNTTYFINNVISTTQLQVSTTLASFTGVSSFSGSTAVAVNAPFGQYSTVTVTNNAGGSPAATILRDTANTAQVGVAGQNAYPAIQVTAFLPSGTRAISETDIISQKGSRRYKVENIEGSDVCLLVAPTATALLSAGQMAIQATDSASGTYWITKLTKNGAVLTQNTGTQFATGTKAIWTTGTAVLNTSVKIDNA